MAVDGHRRRDDNVRYYVTDRGIARGAADGQVDLLDVADADLSSVLARDPELAELAVAPTRETVALDSLTLLAPIRRPGKVVCMAINYQSHVDEIAHVLEALNQKPPTEPIFFIVPSTAIADPNTDTVLPPMAPDQVDYEIELAAVIGKRGRDIAVDDAWDHVAGLALSNDVSARDLQAIAMMTPRHEMAHAKGIDGFKPLGPGVVTLDEFELPLDILLETKVNGEVRQHELTSDMLFDIPTSIAYVSKFFSLEPGDVLLTGSPAGVGFASQSFLKPGDVVELTADGVGTITQHITA